MTVRFKFYIRLLLFFFLMLNSVYSFGGELTLVPVGEATLAKEKITVNRPYYSGTLSSSQKKLTGDLHSLFINDFAFYQNKYFTISNGKNKSIDDRKSYLFLSPNYEYWSNNKTDYLIQIRTEAYKKNRLKATILLFDIRKKKRVYNKAMIVYPTSYRKYGHQIANDIYEIIRGKESIFNSKIVFTSDFESNNDKQIAELYMMDFDGRNVRQLTHHGGIVVSPAISPDLSKVAYTLIRDARFGKRNLELRVLDIESKKDSLLSDRTGINSGAAFFPDGKNIAFTLSYTGSSHIYVMNIKTKKIRRLTRSAGENVDPTLSPDGKTLAFLSGRSGRAMIYAMDSDGVEKNVRQLSFVGKFHATPDYSPDGRHIVFSSWVDNMFDIYRIDTTGSELVRLTRNFGSNENPSFSNDSEFIIFSNQRVINEKKALFTIYLMDRDGEILGPLSEGLGNCRAPKWSK